MDAQLALGITNPKNFKPGLRLPEQAEHPFLASVFRNTELLDLYSWRNGSNTDAKISMAHLWISPGFYWLPVELVEAENKHFAESIEGWSKDWYPILSNGTADRIFVDRSKVFARQVPVYYAFWESAQQIGKIYDSVETMMETMLRCYKEKIYHLDVDGLLDTRFLNEVKIASDLNPNSDYWQRKDLC